MEYEKCFYEQLAEIYDEAAELLENYGVYGWIQGEEHIRDEGYCAIGALNQAAHSRLKHGLNPESAPLRELLYGPLTTYINEASGDDSWESIPQWNDDQDRTKQEVLDAFHAVHKRLLGVEQ